MARTGIKIHITFRRRKIPTQHVAREIVRPGRKHADLKRNLGRRSRADLSSRRAGPGPDERRDGIEQLGLPEAGPVDIGGHFDVGDQRGVVPARGLAFGRCRRRRLSRYGVDRVGTRRVGGRHADRRGGVGRVVDRHA